MNTPLKAPREKAASALAQGQANPPPRILVVDDKPCICQLSSEALILCGYQADTAKDGAVAWDALQLNSYDLLVTDNNMPNVPGVELLKKLHAARIALPVIMATETLPNEEFTRYPWLQPAATLLAPYTIVQLLGMVKEVLRATDSSRARRSRHRQSGKASRRQLVCAYDDSSPPFSVQLTIVQPRHAGLSVLPRSDYFARSELQPRAALTRRVGNRQRQEL